MLADTNFLIDLMSNDEAALRKARELESSGVGLVVGAPSIFELYVGVSLAKRSAEERLKIISTISTLPTLPLDSEAAKVGGVIYGEKFKSGMKIDSEDAMLAGIAKTKNNPVLTRNIKHFSGIDGVRVETY
ncbi:MAG: type II toxin-antitoxin system VapC family toxin [Nitrososphaerota archaeon]|nr:type II toxin-antitoxin system VapC family toxin [Nitrososphaerota archaeon]